MQSQPEQVALLRDTLLHTDPAGFAAAARALSRTRFAGQLPQLRTKTLYVAGADDKAVPGEFLSQYHRLTPGSEFAELAGPHILSIENPSGFHVLVSDFLDWNA
jgi:3-oxoadipate enol-lactonase